MCANNFKLSLIFLLICTGTVIKTNAQALPDDNEDKLKLTFHAGVKGGLNMYQVSGTAFASGFRPGYDVGAFAEINVDEHWGIQPEIYYSQTNYKTGSNFSATYPNGVNNVKGPMNYLSIPFLFTYTPVKTFSIQTGPQLSFMLNNDKALVNNTQTAFKNGDASWIFGLQGNIKKLKVGARYAVGMTNLNGVNKSYTYDLSSWSRNGFQFYVGYRLF